MYLKNKDKQLSVTRNSTYVLICVVQEKYGVMEDTKVDKVLENVWQGKYYSLYAQYLEEQSANKYRRENYMPRPLRMLFYICAILVIIFALLLISIGITAIVKPCS